MLFKALENIVRAIENQAVCAFNKLREINGLLQVHGISVEKERFEGEPDFSEWGVDFSAECGTLRLEWGMDYDGGEAAPIVAVELVFLSAKLEPELIVTYHPGDNTWGIFRDDMDNCPEALRFSENYPERDLTEPEALGIIADMASYFRNQLESPETAADPSR